MAEEPIESCGTCRFGVMSDPADLMARECFGAPPTPILVGGQPVPGGRVQYQIELMRPKLPATTRACSLHKRKAALVGLIQP